MSMRGFTLIELLVTLAILALLGTLVVPVAQVTAQRRDEVELRRALREIRAGIDAYKKASDEGRVAKAAGATGYPPRLEMLVEGVRDQKSPKQAQIYFMRRLPRDPFHADPAVSNAETWGKRSYASEAHEPKEGDDVYDVYSMSGKTALNGTPYNKW
ncbi:type II secretion system pseudopilin PulG [Massilia varians]|uniref:Type II secretion system pseudopilin PulG n=1 Tax=Massilia varians TaxID=457921 RepID=A0ABN6T7N5_9BURK|nr:type II secretion system protein [Massilia varians]BDT58237.1 type II secretion system pseudopilin PulG [Massilia varians]